MCARTCASRVICSMHHCGDMSPQPSRSAAAYVHILKSQSLLTISVMNDISFQLEGSRHQQA